jgi:ABC-type dipeptide/oligopeptide/nickel transport system ATPase component
MKSQLSDKDKSGSTQVQRKILEVKDLRTYFFLDQGVLKAVDGVTLYLNQGEAVGIIGESGCGKSVTGLSLLGLVQPPGLVVAGEIKLERKDGEIVSLLV